MQIGVISRNEIFWVIMNNVHVNFLSLFYYFYATCFCSLFVTIIKQGSKMGVDERFHMHYYLQSHREGSRQSFIHVIPFLGCFLEVVQMVTDSSCPRILMLGRLYFRTWLITMNWRGKLFFYVLLRKIGKMHRISNYLVIHLR